MAVMVMVEVMVMGAATVVAMDMATVVAAYREGSDNWPLPLILCQGAVTRRRLWPLRL
jgi:hypothetical protein